MNAEQTTPANVNAPAVTNNNAAAPVPLSNVTPANAAKFEKVAAEIETAVITPALASFEGDRIEAVLIATQKGTKTRKKSKKLETYDIVLKNVETVRVKAENGYKDEVKEGTGEEVKKYHTRPDGMIFEDYDNRTRVKFYGSGKAEKLLKKAADLDKKGQPEDAAAARLDALKAILGEGLTALFDKLEDLHLTGCKTPVEGPITNTRGVIIKEAQPNLPTVISLKLGPVIVSTYATNFGAVKLPGIKKGEVKHDGGKVHDFSKKVSALMVKAVQRAGTTAMPLNAEIAAALGLKPVNK